jgi:hypothetical protein
MTHGCLRFGRLEVGAAAGLKALAIGSVTGWPAARRDSSKATPVTPSQVMPGSGWNRHGALTAHCERFHACSLPHSLSRLSGAERDGARTAQESRRN